MYQEIIKKIVELGDTQKNEVAIEKAIVSLIQTFPGEHLIYAEELHNNFKHGDSVWIIDPISGTMNLKNNLPHYSITLAHLKNGEVVFALVYDPSVKELFTAEKGKGAFLNGKKISVSDKRQELFYLFGPHLDPTSPFRQEEVMLLDKISEGCGAIRIMGSLGVHYAYVACGRVDAAVSFIFDTFPEFAGKLLVEEAGGKFTDFDGKPLTTESRKIIATNGLVHKQVEGIIQNVVKPKIKKRLLASVLK